MARTTRRGSLRGWGLLLAVVLAAYAPALRAGFVWDDDTFLTANPLIPAADGLRRIWLSAQGPDYWPVTSSTLWLEWRAWGAHALGYHATNLLLHWITCGLLWTLLRRLQLPGAFLAALLFAVHPLNVESVAWITQRKNLVAMVFYLAAIHCFLRGETDRFAEPPAVPRPNGRRRAWYAASLLAFTFAMLGKTSVAILPLVLGGILAWRRRLAVRAWLRLLPFAAVAALLALVAIAFENRSLAGAVPPASGVQRLLGAAAAIWFYLGKALLPIHLVFVYPRWRVDPAKLLWWTPLLAWLGATAALALGARRSARVRAALYAWEYFCVCLLPGLGFVDFYFRRYSLVADHYAHLALIGVVVPVAAAWDAWRSRRPLPAGAAAAVLLFLLGFLTWRRCETFRDAETLYRATLRANPSAWMAHNNLAVILEGRGEHAAALREFEAAVALNPAWAEAHFNLGALLQETGQPGRAMDEYRQALRLRPGYPKARLALADLLAAAGRGPEAEAQTELAFTWADTPAVHCRLARAYAEEGRRPEAIAEYQAALRLNPAYAPAREGLAAVEAASRRFHHE